MIPETAAVIVAATAAHNSMPATAMSPPEAAVSTPAAMSPPAAVSPPAAAVIVAATIPHCRNAAARPQQALHPYAYPNAQAEPTRPDAMMTLAAHLPPTMKLDPDRKKCSTNVLAAS